MRAIRTEADRIVSGKLTWKGFLDGKGFTQESEALARQIFAAQSHTRFGAQQIGVRFADGLREGRQPTKRAVDSLVAVLESMAPRSRQAAAETAVGMARVLEQRGSLPKGSAKRIRDSIVHQFDDVRIKSVSSTKRLATGVAASMVNLEHAVDDGLHGITTSARTSLIAFGVKPTDFKAEFKKGKVASPFGPTPGDRKATGGLMTVGRPGAAGVDNVPAMLNGQPAVIAEGEDVAVINRHQRRALDSRLSDQGGLSGFFARNTRPHYMAGGGIISRAERLDDMHLPYVWGGHHGDKGPISNPAPGVDCSTAVSYVLGIPPRVSGGFMNYGKPGPGPVTIYANPEHVFMSINGRGFGTSGENPGGGPGWLSYGSRPGFAVRHVGLGAGGDAGDTNITAPKIAGPEGILKKLGQAALDQSANAARKFVDAKAATSSSGMDPAGAGGAVGGWHDTLKQQATERGWSAADWEWIVSHESGGKVSAPNASGSGAFGLGQLMPSNYGRLGGGPGSGGPEQIIAMARYIKERYGNPTKAKAWWEQHHSYAKGGLIRAATGTLAAAAKNKAKPKKQPKKKTAPKHWRPRKDLKFNGKVAQAIPELTQLEKSDARRGR